MVSFVEVIIGASVVWSIYSSIKGNKKKLEQKNNQTSQVEVERPYDALFSELASALGENRTEITKTVESIKEKFSQSPNERGAAELKTKPQHIFPTHEKRKFAVKTPTKRFNVNARLNKVKIDDEYAFAVDHEHFDTSIKGIHPLEKTIEVEKNEHGIAIDVLRLLSPENLAETILLTQVLDKPVALRRK